MKKKLQRIVRALRDLKHLRNKTKNGFLTAFQLFIFMIRNGGKFKVFFLLRLHEKDRQPGQFLSERKYRKLDPQIAPPYFRVLLENKIVFYRYMKGLGKIAIMPETLGYLTRDHFLLPDETTKNPFSAILQIESECFVKEATGYCGQNIFMYKNENEQVFINGKESQLSQVRDLILDTSIVQKKVEQHPDLQVIYPGSLNTMRIITCNKGSEYKIYSTILRTGRGGSFIDNTSAGNIMIGVNKESGNLEKYAWSLTSIRDMYMTSHPDTGFRFEGHTLPFFSHAKNLCLDLHSYFPAFFLLGWDVAFTSNGPVIIECNNLDSILSTQIISGGIKSEFYTDFKAFRK